MNIQQINQTGQDISAFVITAIVMVLSTTTLWTVSSKLTAFRRELVDSREKTRRERPLYAPPFSWKEKLFFVDWSFYPVSNRIQWYLHLGYWHFMWKKKILQPLRPKQQTEDFSTYSSERNGHGTPRERSVPMSELDAEESRIGGSAPSVQSDAEHERAQSPANQDQVAVLPADQSP